LICVANLALWLFVTHQVRAHADTVKFLLTLAWGIFALLVFAAGFLLRERAQRWMGLIVLGFAVGRIVLLDVWRLETGLRILTFMGLGLVLLLIGYVYNRYSERIREWL
jgi:uncharacterized membrane protein